jgi:hypothetical protein
MDPAISQLCISRVESLMTNRIGRPFAPYRRLQWLPFAPLFAKLPQAQFAVSGGPQIEPAKLLPMSLKSKAAAHTEAKAEAAQFKQKKGRTPSGDLRRFRKL